MKQETVLLTGGSGFVGGVVAKQLSTAGYQLRIPVRRARESSPNVEFVQTGDLTIFADWNRLLQGVDHVVHLVARTHMTDEFGASAMKAYRETNVDVTRRLTKAAKANGVRRVVYMSSIKAVGNSSDEALTESSPCEPIDSYGITKLEAEQTIQETLSSENSETTYSILRPPLVYGVGVRGNFLRLLNLVKRGLPMPRVDNRRSMVHVSNLSSAIQRCLVSDGAKNQIFHVSDPEPISTGELVVNMAAGMGRRALTVPFPSSVLMGLGRVIGKEGEVRRITDSLVVSPVKIQSTLDWQPAISTPEGVRETSATFAQSPWHGASREAAAARTNAATQPSRGSKAA